VGAGWTWDGLTMLATLRGSDMTTDNSALTWDRWQRLAPPTSCVQFLGLSSALSDEVPVAPGIDSAMAAGQHDVAAHARALAALHRPDACGICLGCLDAGRLAGVCCPAAEWARAVLRMASRKRTPCSPHGPSPRLHLVQACASFPNHLYIQECEDPIMKYPLTDEKGPAQ
jgi:hypothetical protein